MFDAGADEGGGELGAEGEGVLLAFVEGEHLLLDDVGDLADGADEEVRRFEKGSAHLAVAVRFGDAACGVFNAAPDRHAVGEVIFKA